MVNRHESMPATFTHAPDLDFPAHGMEDTIRDQVGGNAEFIEATRLATTLLGDALATNMFLVGYAWQKGRIPLAEASILRAVELNGAMVDFNVQAFRWGRLAAHDPSQVERIAAPPVGGNDHRRLSETLDELIGRRVGHLAGYQNTAWASRYRALVDRVRAAENAALPGTEDLTEAVARSLATLMSYKDEYEVARLYSDPAFVSSLKEQFEDWKRLEIHLAPPFMGAEKRRFGPWVLRLMPVLARLKGLRGTAFDPFGRTPERKLERRLIAEFEAAIETILARLSPDNHALAVEIASAPRRIRGFGHIKLKAAAEVQTEMAEMLRRLDTPEGGRRAAE